MGRKILVTAFKPFGLSPTTLLLGNRSETMLQRIRNESGQRYDYEVFPVDGESNVQLRAELARDPSAVLLMGFDLLPTLGHCGINVEPVARDGQQRVESPFVNQRIRGGRFLGRYSCRQGIGNDLCNEVYLEALRGAAARRNVPVAFMHVAYSSGESQGNAIRDVLNALPEA
jgi:hypothetical protein